MTIEIEKVEIAGEISGFTGSVVHTNEGKFTVWFKPEDGWPIMKDRVARHPVDRLGRYTPRGINTVWGRQFHAAFVRHMEADDRRVLREHDAAEAERKRQTAEQRRKDMIAYRCRSRAKDIVRLLHDICDHVSGGGIISYR